jgi:hypothetical protein
MPLNPRWAAQRDHNQLPPVPNDGNKNKCVRRPDRPDCTAQPTVIDKPPFIGWGILCDLIPESQIHGHVDWLPATSTGYLRWIHLNYDLDYNFSLFPDADHGLTQNNQTYGDKQFIELEFDAREVANRFATPTWKKFVDAAGFFDSDGVNQWLNPASPETPPNAVVTGLFNLDCEHDCRSELHPVYVLAIQTNDSPDDNTWALFVRNWGDGGSCSGDNHQLELAGNVVHVLLPNSGQKAANILLNKTEFAVSPGSNITFPDIGFFPGQGYVVSFTLPDPRTRPLAELVLHLQWPAGTPQPTRIKLPLLPKSALEGSPEESAESYLGALFQKVETKPAISQGPELRPQLASEAFVAPESDQVVQPPAAIKVKTFASAKTGTAPVASPQNLPRIASVTDEVKQQRDETLFRQLCAAYKAKGEALPSDKIPDLPKLCAAPEMQ